jgi:hypothetical protein
MLERNSLQKEEPSIPFQVETDQAALSQEVAARGSNRLLWTGSGLAVLVCIGVSACAFLSVAPHATGEPSRLVPNVAFNRALPALSPGGIRVARHPGSNRARPAGLPHLSLR